MSNVVNLNKFRKQKSRADKTQRAKENRALFGATKAQKDLNKARADKARKDLSGKELGKDED